MREFRLECGPDIEAALAELDRGRPVRVVQTSSEGLTPHDVLARTTNVDIRELVWKRRRLAFRSQTRLAACTLVPRRQPGDEAGVREPRAPRPPQGSAGATAN